jgi:inhibitor of KinA sporulation pathway (predicted exonuclease)
MEEFYKKLLAKPKAYRIKLVYIITAVFGVIIFSLWMILTIDNFQKTVNPVTEENTTKKIPSLKEKYQEQTSENEKLNQEFENIMNNLN